MKNKQIFTILAIMAALLIISSQVVAASHIEESKKTPPGLVKTPATVATQKANDKTAKLTGKSKGKHENYKGTITSVDAGSITVVLKDETSITAALTNETSIRVPKIKGATVGNLAPGMMVMVQAIRGQDDSLTARKILLIPGKPAKTHGVGIVTDYQAGSSITIQAKDEQYYTYLITAETKILPADRLNLLAVGARVTIISPRDVSTLDQTATGIVVHPAIIEE